MVCTCSLLNVNTTCLIYERVRRVKGNGKRLKGKLEGETR